MTAVVSDQIERLLWRIKSMHLPIMGMLTQTRSCWQTYGRSCTKRRHREWKIEKNLWLFRLRVEREHGVRLCLSRQPVRGLVLYARSPQFEATIGSLLN
jgi:hypothetical protein